MSNCWQPGYPAHYVNLAGTSDHPHGGRDYTMPEVVNRRVQVVHSDDPATDRWIALTTVRITPTPLYRVGVINGHNEPVDPPADFPTLRRARNAANKLHAYLMKETH